MSDQYTAFLNCLQLYSQYRLSYCLRRKKGDTMPYCQFFYLCLLAQWPSLTKEINYRDYIFIPACNQAILNQSSPVITIGWMANTDIQPSITLYTVLNYLGKYISKPEKASVSYTELQVYL